MLYEEMLNSYPPAELFEHLPKVGEKYSLSEKSNPRQYRDYVASTPVWREFNRWVKSTAFIETLDTMLRTHHLDLGLSKRYPGARSGGSSFGRTCGEGESREDRFACARFEFSALPADSGCIYPHTDAQRKLITLILPILKEGEWSAAWGGGTDINRAVHERQAFNWVNKNVSFKDVEVVDTVPFAPNQCIVFLKTFNSLHSVRPMTGTGSSALRKTLTINVEEDW